MMQTESSLAGKRVLITAGASGLGLEMARQFLEQKCRVFISDIDEQALEAAKQAHPALETAVGDISDENEVAALFAEVQAKMKGLDVLVNNAGIAGPTGLVETLSKADWDKTLAVNITGQFLCARLAVPMLKESGNGVMINLSSAAGHLGFKGRSAYSASKWAVVGFTKTLAIELGPYGVRVNAILPGAVDGERIRQVIAAKAPALGTTIEELTRTYERQSSLERMIDARDVANMAVFLAGDTGRNISGQALSIDGHTQALY